MISPEIQDLSLQELRQQWAIAWNREPHAQIGRTMLEASLAYKQREARTEGFTPAQTAHLAQLVRHYRRNPECFADRQPTIKPGTRLVRTWHGRRLSVLVQSKGFEFEGRTYSSLSQLASEITGTRWNGWTFFGVKRGKAA
jgi:hypothetical protein